MKIVHGDLIRPALDGAFDVIVHGCNCQNTMGKGIAKAIRDTFPAAYAADQETAKGDRSKLGEISVATVGALTIVNSYTQFDWRGAGIWVDYDAVRSVMRRVKQRYAGRRIGYPKIGAGLAGGDWETIARILDEELAGEDHTLVVLPVEETGGI